MFTVLEIDTLVIRVGTLSRGIKLGDVSVIVLVSVCVLVTTLRQGDLPKLSSVIFIFILH